MNINELNLTEDDLSSFIMSMVLRQSIRLKQSQEVKMTWKLYFDVVLKYSRNKLYDLLGKPIFHLLYTGLIEGGHLSRFLHNETTYKWNPDVYLKYIKELKRDMVRYSPTTKTVNNDQFD